MAAPQESKPFFNRPQGVPTASEIYGGRIGSNDPVTLPKINHPQGVPTATQVYSGDIGYNKSVTLDGFPWVNQGKPDAPDAFAGVDPKQAPIAGQPPSVATHRPIDAWAGADPKRGLGLLTPVGRGRVQPLTAPSESTRAGRKMPARVQPPVAGGSVPSATPSASRNPAQTATPALAVQPPVAVSPAPTAPGQVLPPTAFVGPRGGTAADKTMGLGYTVNPDDSVTKTLDGQETPMRGGFSVAGGRVMHADGSYSYPSADGQGIFTRNAQGELVNYSSPTVDAARGKAGANGSGAAATQVQPPRSFLNDPKLKALYDEAMGPSGGTWGMKDNREVTARKGKQKAIRDQLPGLIQGAMAADAGVAQQGIQADATRQGQELQFQLGQDQLAQQMQVAAPKLTMERLQATLLKKITSGKATPEEAAFYNRFWGHKGNIRFGKFDRYGPDPSVPGAMQKTGQSAFFYDDYGNVQSLDEQATAGQPQAAPKAGTVVDGYRFRGGNPADPNSWEKA